MPKDTVSRNVMVILQYYQILNTKTCYLDSCCKHSVGEFKVMLTYFINKYHDEFLLLITTTTLSAANYATDKL